MATKGSYRLTVNMGPVPGKEYEIAKESVTLGRDVNNDIVVNDAEVSRNHLRLTTQADGCLVEDLGSTNGTFIDGKRITQPTLLRPGGSLGLGETVALGLSFIPDAQATVVAQQPGAALRPPPGPEQPAPAPAPEEAAPQRSSTLRWVAIGCGCLSLVACIAAIAIGWYLWNAPPSFWRSLGF